MRKLSSVGVGLSVMASVCGFGQSQAQAAATVRILAGGKTTAIVKLPEGKLRFSANAVKTSKGLQGKKGSIKLSGKVAIDVLDGQKPLMHIAAEEAVVEAG
jgi:uncharacterized beta-barrel protein YwiB (DUF1934 family)